MIVLFVFLFFFFVTFVLFVKYTSFKRNVLWNFKHCNVIVAGKKGTGKDLVFQYVINHRKDFYYSNISYGGKHKIVSLHDVSVSPNTYNNFVDDKVVKIKRSFKEEKDVYISDIGIFLPSYMDSTLYKKFPSMPIYYALSRHLYNSNVHCNTQNIERGWKALREQADFFIITKRTFKLFGFIFVTKMYTYDRYESAKQNFLPIKKRILNKYSKAEYDLYNATHGDIRCGYLIQFRSQLKYDTRAFGSIILKGRKKS